MLYGKVGYFSIGFEKNMFYTEILIKKVELWIFWLVSLMKKHHKTTFHRQNFSIQNSYYFPFILKNNKFINLFLFNIKCTKKFCVKVFYITISWIHKCIRDSYREWVHFGVFSGAAIIKLNYRWRHIFSLLMFDKEIIVKSKYRSQKKNIVHYRLRSDRFWVDTREVRWRHISHNLRHIRTTVG